jgi:protease I
MAEGHLKGLRVAILATDGFEQTELTEPKKALEAAGAIITILAPHGGHIQGMRHDDKGEKISVDQTLDEADPGRFDAALLPGGALNADALRVVKKAQEFIKSMDQQHKPVAVICHGPWLLVSSELVRGRTLTSYHTIQDDIRNAGGTWEDREVMRDRNWVSSRKPQDIPAFNGAMIELFTEHQKATAHRAA